MVRLIIAGSRNATYEDTIKGIHTGLGSLCVADIDCVLSGKAKGPDTMGAIWAQQNRIAVEFYPADWEQHGKSAGYIRNSLMADNATHLIAIWDGKSKGTKHMIDIAESKGLKTYVEKIDITTNLAIESYNLSDSIVANLEELDFGDSKLLIIRNHFHGYNFSTFNGLFDWEQDEYNFGGKVVKSPRLIHYEGKDYNYSGTLHNGHELSLTSKAIMLGLSPLIEALGLDPTKYNSCLYNYYRDGNDSIGMHSDDEPEIDQSYPIIGVSFGESRTIVLLDNVSGFRHRRVINNGDVFIMLGNFQKHLKHGIPKEQDRKERLSLTFRKIS